MAVVCMTTLRQHDIAAVTPESCKPTMNMMRRQCHASNIKPNSNEQWVPITMIVLGLLLSTRNVQEMSFALPKRFNSCISMGHMIGYFNKI